MKTVIVPAPGKIEIRQVETPVINAYQALVKTEMVALCNATDSKLVAGKFPGVDTYPLALGHENAGIVVAVGEKVCNFKVGDRVIGGLISDFGAQGINSGWGGFSEYVVVNDFEVLKEEGLATPEQGCWDSFEIQNAVPSHVQPEEAVISCTWREVLGAFKDFNLTPGKKVIVVGSGPVGLSFVKLGKLFGLGQIDIVDMLPAKLEVARRMGADNGYTPAEISTPEFIASANRSYDAVIDDDALEFLADVANGDARAALTAIELGVLTTERSADGKIHITLAVASECIQKRVVKYDKSGDNHYDTISAFIKSMRGSDPDAAVYYLARMLYAGEDIKFIARRIMICAAEDVSNADPMALVVATSAAQAVERIGMPEAQIILAQAVTYVASAPKSNSAVCAISDAMAAVRDTMTAPIPVHLQDAHYKSSQKLGHGVGYKYAHDYPNHYVKQQYLPDGLTDRMFYHPSENGYEKTIREYFEKIKGMQP